MSGFSFQVNSEPGALSGDAADVGDQLDLFREFLIRDPRVSPVFVVENPIGTVSATLLVEADQLDQAQTIAGDVFNETLDRAGIRTHWVTINPSP